MNTNNASFEKFEKRLEQGIAHKNNNQLEKALTCFEEAEQYASLGDATVEQSVAIGLLYALWANTLHDLGRHDEVIEQYQACWDIWGVKLKDVEHLDADRATVLMNWGNALDSLGRYDAAIEKYQACWGIRGVKLKEVEHLDANRASVLSNWGNALHGLGRYKEAIEQYQACWDIWGVKLKEVEHLDADRAMVLMNWGIALHDLGRHDEAIEKHQACWNIWGVKLKDVEHLDADRAMVLMNWGNVLPGLGRYKEAIEKYQACWGIRGVKLKEVEHLDADRATVLMNWGNALHDLGRHDEAIEKYQACWDISGVKLKEVEHLDEHRATVLVNWGHTLVETKDLHAAHSKYQDAWRILQAHRLERHYDPMRFGVISGWQDCWSVMKDAHGWAIEMNTAMRECLLQQDTIQPPKWLGELYQHFASFHLQWTARVLDEGAPERVIDILSRYSGWRMAQALLDELDGKAQIAGLPQEIQHLRQCRATMYRLMQQLQELERNAGIAPTDGSMPGARAGMLAGGVATPAPSSETQARIDALRQEYDNAYNAMLDALDAASAIPGYAVLARDLGFDTAAIQSQLTDDAAVAVLVNLHSSMKNEPVAKDNKQDAVLNGVLLVTREAVQWIATQALDFGLQHFNQFTTNWARSGAGYWRGIGMQASIAQAPSEAITPVADQSASQSADQYWSDLEQWVQETLWNTIEAKAELDWSAITHCTLVTHGNSHTLPWEMGAPQALNLVRYPGLVLYGMGTGLVDTVQPDNVTDIGVASYQEHDLPFAHAEAQLVHGIWQAQKCTTVDGYNLPNPQRSVQAVHISGHGTHDDTGRGAHLQVNGQSWSVPSLLNTTARPVRVFLSCCFAGRSSETHEGELYGIVSALMQKGVQHVGAATLPMSDPWMMVLGVLTEQKIAQGSTQKQALASAKHELSTGNWDMPAIDEMLEQVALQDLHTALCAIQQRSTAKRYKQALNSHMYGNVHLKQAGWMDKYMVLLDWERCSAQARQAWVGELHDMYPQGGQAPKLEAVRKMAGQPLKPLWRKTPPQPVLGSLIHAVTQFGDKREN